MSKTQSGLGTIKRDWSITSVNAPKSSQEIPWDPTPPKPVQPELSGKEKRLRDIQNALSARSTPAVAQQKRPSDSFDASDAVPPAKKKRQLPPGYGDDDGYDPAARAAHFASSSRSSALAKSTYTAPPPSKKMASVFLSQEQNQILKLAQEGKSLFYTGSAGTGKSVLLREIIKTLRKKHIKATDAVAITASTGIAACNIGGVTIHSFAGIGLGIEDAEELARKIRKNKKASSRWMRTKVLIIDEVSMLDGDLFDKLSRIGSILRKSIQPFGGIQLIVTGDFFQLPPVTKGSSSVKFAFEADLWKQAIARTFNLTKVFRQHDQEFVNMLNEMRFGKLSDKSVNKFRTLSRPIYYDDGLGPTELFPRREDVDRSNRERMNRLTTPMRTFRATDGGTIQDVNQRDKVLANFMAVPELSLREDAQVMLIKNLDETLVNGSMGRVVRFCDAATYGTDRDIDGAEGQVDTLNSIANPAKKPPSSNPGMQYPVVEFMLPNGGKRTLLVQPDSFKVELPTGEVQASRTQLPLILAWAMSIHKSQGQTLDRVKVDLGKVFEKGQAYVALSRATSLEGLQVLNFDRAKVQAHPKVAEWSATLETVCE
ncbi:ATP-dependent DNA helicase PIF1 [Mycena sanguinolenta]|uniref:ATP-dependent DNA helicase PIF1 n=1 Tax=Mycena sanguinolenta TaxID=230812 RepID=A0A8H6Z6T2_9AGAR|nr:ATP-dependent DNA helicase PIF1 [Mycena sanguinolenta]